MDDEILKVMQVLLLWSLGSAVFHIIAVLFGAPLIESALKTFQFGCLLSTLTVLPCCLVLGLDSSNWIRLFTTNSPEDNLEIIVHTCTLTSILGAWFGAFPIPLDWDRPWQEWPISCVIGTIIGYLLGLVISTVKILIFKKTEEKTKFV